MSKTMSSISRPATTSPAACRRPRRLNQALGHALLFDRAEGCRRVGPRRPGVHRPVLQPRRDAAGPRRSRASARPSKRRWTAAPPAPTRTSCTPSWPSCCARRSRACERVRFTGSGTEATMHCLRLARAFTGRPKILKFEGNFHGYHDQVMFAIGTPADQLGPGDGADRATPARPASPPGLEQQPGRSCRTTGPTCSKQAFRRHGHELAAVICEPIYYNAGCILPTPEFLPPLRRLTREHGVLLIFDEVLQRLPHGPRRRAGVSRRHARPVHARQGGRRRLSAERLRRPTRHHGPPDADRRLPAQRHLQRPSGRRRRRPGGRDGLSRSRASTTTSTPSPSGSTTA